MNNYLYHFTTKENFWKIKEENCLRVSVNWKGVSFTRDKNLIKRSKFLKHCGKNMMIVLDKDKLACDYSIKPYNFFADHKFAADECEEIIIKNVTNVSKYIVDYGIIDIKINLRKGFLKEEYM